MNEELSRENVEKTLLMKEDEIKKNLRWKTAISSRVFKESNGKLFSKISGVYLFVQIFIVLFSVTIFFGIVGTISSNIEEIKKGEYLDYYSQHFFPVFTKVFTNVFKYLDYFSVIFMVLLLIGFIFYCPFLFREFLLVLKEKIVFDKLRKHYLIQRKTEIFKESEKNEGNINDIVAVQILQGPSFEKIVRKRGFSMSATYTHRELNLVLQNSSRINVFECDDYQRVFISARKIADFLAIPLWDNTEDEGGLKDFKVL